MEHVLKIEVNGEFLTFFPDAKVKMIRKSPLFLNEADPGSRIYTFTVPAEPNGKILNFGNVLFNNKKITTLDCNLYLKGNFYKKAKLDITGFTKETYDIRVRFDRPYFLEAAERKLRSFEYNDITPFRYLKLIANTEYPTDTYYERIYTYVTGTPTNDFTVELEFEAPLMDFTIQTKTFSYSTANPETLTEFIIRIKDWFIANFNTYGIYCEVTASDRLYFITPYTDFGRVNLIHNQDAMSLSQLDVNWPITFASAAHVWYENIQQANDTVVNPENYDFIYFPFYAPNGNSFTFYRPVVNLYNPETGFMADYDDPDFNWAYQGLIPFAYLHSVFKHVHNELGLNVEETLFDEEMKSLVYFNNKTFNQTYNGIDASNVRGFDKLNTSFKYAELLPNITYKDFIYDIGNMFCVVFDYESNDEKLRVMPRKKILASTELNDLTNKVIFDYISEINNEKFSLAYKWDSAETLAQSRINPNNNLTPRADVTDFSSLPTPTASFKNALIRTVKENLRYIIEPIVAGYRWIFYDESLEDYKPADATTNIETGLSTLFQNKFKYKFWNMGLPIRVKEIDWLLPYTGANIDIDKAENNTGSPRLLFYRGMKECDNYVYNYSGASGEIVQNIIVDENDKGTLYATSVGQYPFASYHNYDFKGNKCGNYSLAWNAEDGLVNVWWKEWLNYLDNTYQVTLQFEMTFSEYMQLDLLKKIQVGNQQYFIDEMEVELQNEISLVTVRAFIIKTGE